jgi:hypothetical protein
MMLWIDLYVRVVVVIIVIVDYAVTKRASFFLDITYFFTMLQSELTC